MKDLVINKLTYPLLVLLCLCTFFDTSAAEYIDNKKAPNSKLITTVTPFIAAINSGNKKNIKHFIEQHFSTSFMPEGNSDELVNYLLSLYFGYGELQFHSYRHYSPTFPNELLVVVYSPLTESYQMLSLMNTENNTNKISNFDFSPARWPSNVKKLKRLSEAKAMNELQSYIHRMSQHDIFTGSVLIARGEQVLLKMATGEANKSLQVDNTINTRFDLASMGKMFTAVAINQLFQSATLTPTDTLDKYLDSSWLPISISQKIQIQHLLTHTSGLGNYAARMDDVIKSKLVNLIDYKPLFKGESLAFEPGTRQQYSNSGMFLLGVVIEKLTSLSYFDYIEQKIFKPSNMKLSGFLERNQPHNNVAIGYERTNDNTTGWFDNSGVFGIKGTPDGGSFSTVVDMHQFALALAKNKLLTKSTTKQMLTNKPALNSHYYGYGFNVSGKNKNHNVGHEGGHYGISTSFSWYPKTDYTVIVLSNLTEGAASINNKAKALLERIAH